VVEIWPDTLVAHNAFVALSTQWRTSYGGLVGLDYNAIPPVFRLIGIPRKEWPDLFEDLRVMEAETLRVIAKRADQ
jgi:hypothetical protein